MNKDRNAFTLIELLVVIAIIAILAAILFPVFATAREKARATACLSNEKQMGLGLAQYVQDYDEAIPMDQYYILTGSGCSASSSVNWPQMLAPYIQKGATATSPVFQCPSFPTTSTWDYGVHSNLFPDGANTWASNCGLPVTTYSITQIPSPSQTVAIVEKGQGGGWTCPSFSAWESAFVGGVGNPAGSYNQGNDARYDLNPCPIANTWSTGTIPGCGDCDYVPGTTYGQVDPSCASMPRYRHNLTCNMIFFDGHAKAMVRGKLDWYQNVWVPVMGNPGS